MLTRKQTQTLAERILQRCAPQPAEVLLFHTAQALTRFANNTIHQNVAERDAQVILRVFNGRRMGTATTNRFDEAALDELAERARTSARLSPEDPHFVGLSEPTTYASVRAFDEGTAAFAPEERANAVGAICRLSAEKGLNASGAFSTGTNEIAYANSQGVFAYHLRTNADFQTTVMSEDSSGRARGSGWRVETIDVEALGQEAIHKAERGRNPRKIEPGDYTVILDPYATQDILSMLNFTGMGARAVLEGRSWMNSRMGKKTMSELINIWDDGLDRNGFPLPFDFEGTPKQRVDIVQQGVVLGPVYDRYTAKKAGKSSTGHALPPTMRSFGPIAMNLFMQGGDSSLEEMIRTTDRGLYITRFWYTRPVTPPDCVVTGMTRDGVFMIENGEIAYPVKNLRFTQSYVTALANIEALSAETHLLLSEYGGFGVRVPAIKVNGFHFTGTTV